MKFLAKNLEANTKLFISYDTINTCKYISILFFFKYNNNKILFLVCGGEITSFSGEISLDFNSIKKTTNIVECEWHIKNIHGSFVSIVFR